MRGRARGSLPALAADRGQLYKGPALPNRQNAYPGPRAGTVARPPQDWQSRHKPRGHTNPPGGFPASCPGPSPAGAALPRQALPAGGARTTPGSTMGPQPVGRGTWQPERGRAVLVLSSMGPQSALRKLRSWLGVTRVLLRAARRRILARRFCAGHGLDRAHQYRHKPALCHAGVITIYHINLEIQAGRKMQQ